LQEKVSMELCIGFTLKAISAFTFYGFSIPSVNGKNISSSSSASIIVVVARHYMQVVNAPGHY
jgi:hypothetical protein